MLRPFFADANRFAHGRSMLRPYTIGSRLGARAYRASYSFAKMCTPTAPPKP